MNGACARNAAAAHFRIKDTSFAIDTRSKSLGQQTGATGALKDAEKRARATLKVLDSVVSPILAATPGASALLSEWKSIHRVMQKPGPVIGTAVSAIALPDGKA